MKHIFYCAIFLYMMNLVGCSTNESPSHQPSNKSLNAQLNSIEIEIVNCISSINQGDDARYVNKNLLVIMRDSPNKSELFSSHDKITAEQVVVLKRYRESTLKCRDLTKKLPRESLVKAANNYYSNIDSVYDDLISGKITVGTANQERAIQTQYARDEFSKILSSLDKR